MHPEPPTRSLQRLCREEGSDLEGRLKSWACGDSATKAERSSSGSRAVSVLVEGTREERQRGAVRGLRGQGGHLGCGGAVGAQGWGRAGVLWSVGVRQARPIPGGNCEVLLAVLVGDSTRDRNGSHQLRTWARVVAEGATCGLTHTGGDFPSHPTFLVNVEPKGHKKLVIRGSQGWRALSCAGPQGSFCSHVAFKPI